MLEVEREPVRRIERAEQELDHPLVAGALEDDAHRPEPVAQVAHPLVEGSDDLRPVAGQLDGELEAVGHLVGPAAELLLGGQAVARRVELDGVEALRVVGEELLRVGSGGIEARPPGRIRPAGGSDMCPG